MDSPFVFYGRFLVLLATVSLMVVIHYVRTGFHGLNRQVHWHVAEAKPERGRELIRDYGCAACHTMPGATPAARAVGPSLQQIPDQLYIAGGLANTPENLIRWIQEPESIRPNTAMPNLSVGPEDARDIAAYLYQRPSLFAR